MGNLENRIADMNSDAVEKLLDGLNSDDPRERMQHVKAALEIRDRNVADTLVPRLETEENPKVKAAMVYVIGQLGDKSHVAVIAKKTSDPEPRVRLRAVEALGRLRAPAGYPVLIRVLSAEDDEKIRSLAASTILKLGTERTLLLFEEMVRSDKEWKRQAAILAAQLFNSPLIVPVLEFAMARETGPNRRLARSGLARLADLGNRAAHDALQRIESQGSPSEADLERVSQQLAIASAAGVDRIDDTYTGDMASLHKSAEENDPFGGTAPAELDPEKESERIQGSKQESTADSRQEPRSVSESESRSAPREKNAHPPTPHHAAPMSVPLKPCPVCGTQAPRTQSHCQKCGSPMDASLSGLMGRPKDKARDKATAPSTAPPWLGAVLRGILGMVLLAIHGAVVFHAYGFVAGGMGGAASAIQARLLQLAGFAACALAVSGSVSGFLTLFQVRTGLVYALTFRGAYIGYVVVGMVCARGDLIGAGIGTAMVGAFIRKVNSKLP